VRYTWLFFERVIVETPKYIVNSFLYSVLAVVLCIVVGVPIAWILARTRLPGRDTLDGLNTLILAVPAPPSASRTSAPFTSSCRGSGCRSRASGSSCARARRAPAAVHRARLRTPSLLLVHRSMEEAAASVGATGVRSFRDVTLPLIWRGVLVGSLFSFMTSLQEASAVLFCRWAAGDDFRRHLRLLPSGSANEAAALGVILSPWPPSACFAINRLAGTRMGGMFG